MGSDRLNATDVRLNKDLKNFAILLLILVGNLFDVLVFFSLLFCVGCHALTEFGNDVFTLSPVLSFSNALLEIENIS